MTHVQISLLLAALGCLGCSSKVEDADASEASDTSTSSEASGASGVSEADPSVSAPSLPQPAEEMAGSFHNLFQTDQVYFAGLPQEEGLKQMQAAGVKLVVNILTEPEVSGGLPFDEPALVKSLGMTYVHIPVSPKSFSRKDVDKFADAMAKADGKVLVHCASSNRVGAMWASYLMLHKGFSKDQALSHGKAAGLRAPSMVAAFERVTGS